MKETVRKLSGTYKLQLTCPRCGDSRWIRREGKDPEWECTTCGEPIYPEDMCSEAVECQ